MPMSAEAARRVILRVARGEPEPEAVAEFLSPAVVHTPGPVRQQPSKFSVMVLGFLRPGDRFTFCQTLPDGAPEVSIMCRVVSAPRGFISFCAEGGARPVTLPLVDALLYPVALETEAAHTDQGQRFYQGDRVKSTLHAVPGTVVGVNQASSKPYLVRFDDGLDAPPVSMSAQLLRLVDKDKTTRGYIQLMEDGRWAVCVGDDFLIADSQLDAIKDLRSTYRFAFNRWSRLAATGPDAVGYKLTEASLGYLFSVDKLWDRKKVRDMFLIKDGSDTLR